MNHQEQATQVDPPEQNPVIIIVNGRRREFAGKAITFEQVVRLAFDSPPHGENTMFTVTYKHGPHGTEGTMVSKSSVRIQDRMVFNVTATDKS